MTVKEAQQLLNMRAIPKSAQAIMDVYAKQSHALQATLPYSVGKAKKVLDQQIAQLSEARDVLLRLVPPPPKPSAPARSISTAPPPPARNKPAPNAPATPGPFIDPAIVQMLQALVRWIAQIPKTARQAYVGTVTAYRVTSSALQESWRRGSAWAKNTWETATYITKRCRVAIITTFQLVSRVIRWLWRLSTGCVGVVWRVSNYLVVRAGLVAIVAVATLYALWLIVESYPRTAHVPEVAAGTPSSPPTIIEAKPTKTIPHEPNPTNNDAGTFLGATLSIPEPVKPSAPIPDEPPRPAPLTPPVAVNDEGKRTSVLDISDLDFHVAAETPTVPSPEPVTAAETNALDFEEMFTLFHGADGARSPGEGVTADGNDDIIREENGVDVGREAQMWEVLESMDAQLAAELIDAELAERDEQPLKCFARFLAWPPCEVYCGERQVTQAPDPRSYEFVSGDHTFRFVHEEELVLEQTLTFQPGAHHKVEISLLAGTVDVKEE